MSAEPNQPLLDETSSVSTTVPDEPKQDPGTISGAACLEKADNVEKTEQENTSAESGTATENHVLEPNQPVVDETSSTSVTVPEKPKENEQENTSAEHAEGGAANENHTFEKLDESESTSTDTSASSEDETDSESDDSEEVILYHYTTEDGAKGIRKNMKIEQDHFTYARMKHKQHGPGVYFTQLNHHCVSRRQLITNNFMKSGETVKNEYVFLKRLAYVVKIAFPRSKVDKIRDGDRDIWIHRGDIHLKKYKNKHWIYSTQNPSDTL